VQVNIHQAKSQLSKLIEAVERGEEVIIARNNVPVAQIMPIAKKKFRFGGLEHILTGPIPDFLEPMPEDELRLWEGRDDEGPA
jgi:prevent-host-death family protein